MKLYRFFPEISVGLGWKQLIIFSFVFWNFGFQQFIFIFRSFFCWVEMVLVIWHVLLYISLVKETFGEIWSQIMVQMMDLSNERKSWANLPVNMGKFDIVYQSTPKRDRWFRFYQAGCSLQFKKPTGVTSNVSLTTSLIYGRRMVPGHLWLCILEL